MKHNYILTFAFVLYALFGVSACGNLTPEQQQQLNTVAINGLKDATAAGVGYAQGGKVGAVSGLTAQVIKNHTAAAKNPAIVQP